MSKEEYDTTDYRKYNKELCLNIVNQIAEYKKHDYQLLGIVGISESPSCDTILQKGVFMEELFTQLKEKKIDLDTFDIQADYTQDNCKNTEDGFKKWLSSKINYTNLPEDNSLLKEENLI
jgi:predicted secreted protein